MLQAWERRRDARHGAPAVAAAAALPAISSAARLGRAASLAAVAVVLGTGGHVLGAGFASVPPPALLAGLACLLAAAGLLLGRREWSRRAIAAGLVAGQLAVHLGVALAALAGGGAGAGAGGAAGDGLGPAASLLCHPGATLAGTHGGGLRALLLMAAGHAAATVACAWWLRRGEAALWARLREACRVVARAAARVAPPAPRLLVPARPPRPRLAPAAALPVALAAPGRGLSRRGPPCAAALA